jgi:hypothetical protein
VWRWRGHRRWWCIGETYGKRKERQGWLNRRVRKQRCQLRAWRRCRGGRVKEIRLVEHNVSRNEDSARGEVKATLPLVVRGVTEKHTTNGAGRQLVRSRGGGVRVTSAPEDTKMIVARRGGVSKRAW